MCRQTKDVFQERAQYRKQNNNSDVNRKVCVDDSQYYMTKKTTKTWRNNTLNKKKLK